MKIKVTVKEYQDKYVIECVKGGFEARKPLSQTELRAMIRSWLDGFLPRKADVPLSTQELEYDQESL